MSAMPLHDRILEVTARIRDRSVPTRADYLARVTAGSEQGVAHGTGRELFATFRAVAADAEAGALACM